MVTLTQVQNGLVKYIDSEITPKIEGWQKWVFGATMGVSLSKITTIFNSLKNNTFIKMLEVVDDNDNIDIDTIYQEFRKQAQKGAITFNVPIINLPLTLNVTDVDKIYQCIKGGEY
jgi:hypothetical protein